MNYENDQQFSDLQNELQRLADGAFDQGDLDGNAFYLSWMDYEQNKRDGKLPVAIDCRSSIS